MTENDKKPAGTRRRLSPEARREQIVMQTRRLFCDRGHAGFSLREVARACGVNLSAVQHYFPGKDTLISEMINHSVTAYARDMHALVDSLGHDPTGQLLSTIEYLISLNNEPDSARFFINLWSFAHEDATGAKYLVDLYQPMIDWLMRCIRRLLPDLPEEEIAMKANLILSTADGLLSAGMLGDCYFKDGPKPSPRQYAEKVLQFALK
ncbi:MAG TPA: TetR/AcrR family transcriptional regulator [Novosphingobium sp.]|nr:TetR/AcrR family transcriptional regulator [Novosphingobium sp.]HZV09511.1 TetR/AcrR family transcriptional regulator [Novosphingobium sp.]